MLRDETQKIKIFENKVIVAYVGSVGLWEVQPSMWRIILFVKMEKIAQLDIRKLVDDLCSRIEMIKHPRTNHGIDIVLGGYGVYGLKAYLITKNNHDSNEVYELCDGVREILRKEVVVLGPELVKKSRSL
ncbi:hypothetical protein OROGR_013944 [Orobanche gracilis]